MSDATLKYRKQHKQRLNYMPWLYWSLKPKQLEWAKPWQEDWQNYLQDMETVIIEGECFISPIAKIFAERGRPIIIREGAFIAADTVIHGPVDIGKNVGINHHAILDGGRKGIRIGDNCRIAAYCHLYAFNHRFETEKLINEQSVSSKGITLEDDVWLGAHVGVCDGVTIGRGAVIGMQSVVTKNVVPNTVAAGNPAHFIKNR